MWEGDCEIISSTLKDFIQFCDDENRTVNEWRYFDYKRMAECVDDASKESFEVSVIGTSK